MLEENKISKTRVILIPLKKKKKRPYNVFMGISLVVQLAMQGPGFHHQSGNYPICLN